MSPFASLSVVFGGRSSRSVLCCEAEACMPKGHLSFSLKMNHPPEALLCLAAGLLTPALSHTLRSFIRENEAQKVALEEEA